MTKPIFMHMNEKPRITTIIIRNIVLTLLVIAALSVMDKLHAAVEQMPFDDAQANVSMGDVHRGSLLFRGDIPNQYTLAPMLNTDVAMDINGLILRATVTQTFSNESDQWLEGIYVFPLPENAAVDHLRVRIGERIIEGIIQERARAKQTYQKAKAEGKKASLVEQERPNLFTNSVANIGPHETVIVMIEYQQSLQYEKLNGGGQFQFRFPTTITPRYIPGQPEQVVSERIKKVAENGWALNTDQVPDASRITPPITVAGGNGNTITLNVHINAGFPIQDIKSPYHNIDIVRQSGDDILISLRDDYNIANRDFNLIWKPVASQEPKAAIFSQQLAEDYYHLIMVMPPTASMQGGQPLAREVIYIIDTSGSMSGESINQAKQSLQMALQRLRQFDKFNIIQFNSNTSKLFASARSADKDNIRTANEYIESLDADGGTEMLPALQAALGATSQADSTYIRQVIFLTDGAVGNETQLFGYIKQHLGNSRLFTIGIGSAPNSHFMTKAATFGRGTFTYIGSISEISQKLEQLFTKLESPVLHDLHVSWPADIHVEAWPDKLPDLYLGEPVMLSVKTNADAGQVTITGTRANELWQMDLPLARGKRSRGVAALWARQQINSLSNQMLESNDKETLRAQITNIALQHHLVSKYTSLVAVDVTPSRGDEALFVGPMPLQLPAGSNQVQVFGQLARTATPATVHLLLGLLLLFTAMSGRIWMNHRDRRLLQTTGTSV